MPNFLVYFYNSNDEANNSDKHFIKQILKEYDPCVKLITNNVYLVSDYRDDSYKIYCDILYGIHDDTKLFVCEYKNYYSNNIDINFFRS